jgi:hypothetical protein
MEERKGGTGNDSGVMKKQEARRVEQQHDFLRG